jgi:hypothetical protein
MFGSLVAFDLGDPKGASDGRLQGVESGNWGSETATRIFTNPCDLCVCIGYGHAARAAEHPER